MSTMGMAMVKAYSSADSNVLVDARYLAIKRAERAIIKQTEDKFKRIACERKAKEQHAIELRSWAKIASRELYKHEIYKERRAWANKIISMGLASKEEAYALAKVKFKL